MKDCHLGNVGRRRKCFHSRGITGGGGVEGEDMGITGGGEVLIIPQQGVFLIRFHTEWAGAAKPQTFTQLSEQVGRLPRRREAVRPPRFEL